MQNIFADKYENPDLHARKVDEIILENDFDYVGLQDVSIENSI